MKLRRGTLRLKSAAFFSDFFTNDKPEYCKSKLGVTYSFCEKTMTGRKKMQISKLCFNMFVYLKCSAIIVYIAFIAEQTQRKFNSRT